MMSCGKPYCRSVGNMMWGFHGMRPCRGQGVHGPEAAAKAAAAAEKRKDKKKANRAAKRAGLTQFLHLKSNMPEHRGAADGFVDGRTKAGRAAKFAADVARASKQEEPGSNGLEHDGYLRRICCQSCQSHLRLPPRVLRAEADTNSVIWG